VAGTLGVSAMASDFGNRGTETLIPDSRTRTAAAYAFEQAELGRWRFTGGARYDWRTLATGGNADIEVPADARRFGAATGSVGALYRVRGPVALVASVARGFRAPAAPDLYANGFHEGTRAFERGDPTLRVETSLNTEVGVRVNGRALTAEAAAFVNRVSDYIYLRPFGAGGGVFDSLQVVQGDARLAGWEGRVAWRPAPWVTWQASGDYVRGQNTAAGVPLTFVPPLRVQGGVRLEGAGRRGPVDAPYVTAQVEGNARQTRLDPRDLGPPGYTLLNLGAGFTRPTARGVLSVDLSVRNALDTEYRSFLSRYKAFASGPGRAVVLRVATGL
jgi:iron complex outermembrane receptor protein